MGFSKFQPYRFWTLCIAVLCCSQLIAEQTVFDELDAMLEAQFQQTDEMLEADFQALDAALNAAQKRLSKEIEAVWGKDDVVLPSKGAWVDYSENRKLRRKFDFENGVVQIERLIEDGSELTSASEEIKAAVLSAMQDTEADLERKDAVWQYAKKDLQSQSLKMENSRSSADRAVLRELVDTPASLDFTEILRQARQQLEVVPRVAQEVNSPGIPAAVTDMDGQQQGDQVISSSVIEPVPANGELISSVVLDSVNQSKATENKPSLATVTASIVDSGDDKQKIRISIPLRQNYLAAAAGVYRSAVMAQAKRHDLLPSLLYAIMETESHFNPRARSHVPAFGLMQLVPASGGVDAYNYLYGEKLVLGPEYFYDPNQNVELGAAYLNLLDSRYLRSIKDDISRFYCTIAAYNTGPGNVARAFVNSKRIAVAAQAINAMTADAVYQHLVENLPYEETRLYLRKVTSAQKKYEDMDQLIFL
ncbi:MAG: DUF3393 domain-containing protein [Gammaproteobacteria bacterium]|nr:DUF3393 domain-containing protein [Gammaproteobacteria bacterium]MBT5204205.1 DUF3393 domain-containing protein [Gammaproteobacteria bacterium]MBT5601107.1 DUF3393 domain-containing protein [Gammaproteobacteria bacterium]MBT6246912.1 DUF3393 domain-containing protein [Gammaproteobacteria bacterium]